jgi:hypothetical protein
MELHTKNELLYFLLVCEHGNEPFGSIKGGKFLDWATDY